MNNKISAFNVGEKITETLVVIEAAEKKTRASKPYLAVVLSDGESRINGNYWDWDPATGVPAVNTLLNVTAIVTEWQSVKQLNINSLTENTEASLYDFMPSSGKDIDGIYVDAVNFARSIPDEELSLFVKCILRELEGRWKTIPGAKAVHHAYVAGTLIHSLSVARIATDIAKNIPEANLALVMTGAFLHDIGKLFTYGMNGVVIDYTDEGQLYEHAFMGAEFVGNFAEGCPVDGNKLALLRHIILAHHKNLDYGAVITPKCLEAYIVHYADAIDATAEQLREASKTANDKPWLDKIWALDNMRHLNPSYINNKVFAESTQE